MIEREMIILSIKPALQGLQNQLCATLEKEEEAFQFQKEMWSYENGQGGGCTCVLEQGQQLERAGVNFSHIQGEQLPPTATLKRADLVGFQFEALGLSCVIHPRNPYVPTTHLNLRFFLAFQENKVQWWFGGGFDLTPYYGFEEDCQLWHQHAKQACDFLGEGTYEKYKMECDEYFFIKHRNEPRGIGGIFFDDLNTPDFNTCFAFIKKVGKHFISAYSTIFMRRKKINYGDRERDFQLYRRGRYVEFNLLYDRGTLFGLQSQGRVESILISLPPAVNWHYDWHPCANSPEEKLYREFLIKKDWL